MENRVEETKLKKEKQQKEAQDKMLMGVGASFIEELRSNKTFQAAVKKTPNLIKRMEFLGLDIKSVSK